MKILTFHNALFAGAKQAEFTDYFVRPTVHLSVQSNRENMLFLIQNSVWLYFHLFINLVMKPKINFINFQSN